MGDLPLWDWRAWERRVWEELPEAVPEHRGRADGAPLRDGLSGAAGRSLGDYPALSPQMIDDKSEGLCPGLSLPGGERQSHDPQI